jgi:hypothetical protein
VDLGLDMRFLGRKQQKNKFKGKQQIPLGMTTRKARATTQQILFGMSQERQLQQHSMQTAKRQLKE